MNYFNFLHERVLTEINGMVKDGELLPDLPIDNITTESPRDPNHGDVATNAALVLAKPASLSPIHIAELLSKRLQDYDDTNLVEIAGPGFINLRLKNSFWHNYLFKTLIAGENFGKLNLPLSKKRKINIEFVSANPTGPMHIGHARGAVFGDALASVLEFIGHDVVREYYINDAGEQVNTLARSTHIRYLENFGETLTEIPTGLYPGNYLKEVGKKLFLQVGNKYFGKDESLWINKIKDFSLNQMMDLIKDDLAALGIYHSKFVSEEKIIKDGKIEKILLKLQNMGLIYSGVLDPPKGKEDKDWEPREQTLFRSTNFGDDVDRSLQKSDGTWTYFASDAAYHFDKIERGYDTLINVWGADHGGYIKRIKAVVDSLSNQKVVLDVKICQMVHLLRAGKPIKMSKRSGEFVTLRDAVDEVGKDVIRFIMLTRRNDVPLDFDFSLVTEESRDNPVFYVQYAHARCCSILRNALKAIPTLNLNLDSLSSANLSLLTHPKEISVIKSLVSWPKVVETAALSHEPHRIAFFLRELAASFHALWTQGKKENELRFLITENHELSEARIALVAGCALGLSIGLNLMGVTPVKELN